MMYLIEVPDGMPYLEAQLNKVEGKLGRIDTMNDSRKLCGVCDAMTLENFIFHMEQYFKNYEYCESVMKGSTITLATMHLADDTMLLVEVEISRHPRRLLHNKFVGEIERRIAFTIFT